MFACPAPCIFYSNGNSKFCITTDAVTAKFQISILKTGIAQAMAKCK